jgi:hypothetical protein
MGHAGDSLGDFLSGQDYRRILALILITGMIGPFALAPFAFCPFAGEFVSVSQDSTSMAGEARPLRLRFFIFQENQPAAHPPKFAPGGDGELFSLTGLIKRFNRYTTE